MPRGIRIRKNLIDFSGLQGNLVALVLHANNKFLSRCLHVNLVDVAPDFELFASNAMSFVPVYLRKPRGAIRQSDTGDTLSFPPTATTIELAQSPNFSDRGADSKCLDVGDFSDDLKVHGPMLSNHRDVVKLPSNVLLCGGPALAPDMVTCWWPVRSSKGLDHSCENPRA